MSLNEVNSDELGDRNSLACSEGGLTLTKDSNSESIRGITDLQEGEVIRVAIYEEVPEIRRETFVREKVQIKKVLVQENATSQP
ncbi:DUF2382 domain-containing protein [Pantanalinema rosaneae CENA516]|uniref:DUF2382 domain-containing protein n=1 Tax=Pantanalinema rosaneae TaxID=1620701 RepID=UPI003D701487